MRGRIVKNEIQRCKKSLKNEEVFNQYLTTILVSDTRVLILRLLRILESKIASKLPMKGS